MNFHFLCLAAVLMVCGPSGFAKVSIEDKANRVDFIEKIGVAAPSLSVEAYRRELEYERQGLPFEVRAKNEARLLAERIQEQIVLAYDMALKDHGDSEKAIIEIKEAINKDLELASPEFKKELLSLSLKTLEAVKHGGLNNVSSLKNLEKSILSNVEQRSFYLNEEVMDAFIPGDPHGKFFPQINSNSTSEKLEYASAAELVKSLVSNEDSTRWVYTANQMIRSSKTTTTDSNISFQVKIDFLGISVEAGPFISFKREYSTNVNVMAEELNPILLPDGNFDVHKRDQSGKVIYNDGKPKRRFLVFSCDGDLRFSTEYKGSGGFRMAGLGTDSSVSQTYTNIVTMNTRRVLVPDYVGGKSTTVNFLAKICHTDFLKARLNDKLTIEQSLNVSMKNIVSGLRFAHPKTKCAVDTHCIDWYNKGVVAIWKHGTYPRCIEEAREKFRACELRGLEGMSCKVFKDGKLISSGSWEVECDKGLKCVQTQEATWAKRAKGQCRPVNPGTYRDPKKYPEYQTINDLIEVDIL